MSVRTAVLNPLISQDYEGALKNCQNIELQLQEEFIFNDVEINDLLHGFDFYAFYMTCLLLTENMNESKYLWKRVPAQIKTSGNSAVVKLWDIGCFMWENRVHDAFREINNNSWSADLQPLVLRLKNNVFFSRVKSFGKLFATLSVSKLSQLLHLSEAEILQLCQATDLSINPDGTLSIPSEHSSDFIQQQALKFSRDGEVVKDLAKYVSMLEQEPLKVDLSNKKGGTSGKK